MVSRKCHACYAWTSGTDSGRAQGPPPAQPLRCRESATPAMPGRLARIAAALRDHPLRTPL
eukprot:6105273-Pyramimonas_sp.AAC.1